MNVYTPTFDLASSSALDPADDLLADLEDASVAGQSSPQAATEPSIDEVEAAFDANREPLTKAAAVQWLIASTSDGPLHTSLRELADDWAWGDNRKSSVDRLLRGPQC
jgi:hypothetical protein